MHCVDLCGSSPASGDSSRGLRELLKIAPSLGPRIRPCACYVSRRDLRLAPSIAWRREPSHTRWHSLPRLPERAPLLELVRRLHEAGLVGLSRRCRAKLGIFTVAKKNCAQRLASIVVLAMRFVGRHLFRTWPRHLRCVWLSGQLRWERHLHDLPFHFESLDFVDGFCQLGHFSYCACGWDCLM